MPGMDDDEDLRLFGSHDNPLDHLPDPVSEEPDPTPFRVFQYLNDHNVRVVRGADGEPWFVLADLCAVLGVTNVAQVAQRLDEGCVCSTYVTDSLGRQRDTTIVSEPGMYEVVLGSRKAEAVAFKRWITRDVLPAIRKTGNYAIPMTREQRLAYALQDAVAIAEEHRQAALKSQFELEQSEAARADQQRDLDAAKPKVEMYDKLLDSEGCFAVGTVGKMFGISQVALFNKLRESGIFIAKGHMRNTPRQEYMKHFKVNPSHFERSDGSSGTSYTTKVRPSGIEFIARRLGYAKPELPPTK